MHQSNLVQLTNEALSLEMKLLQISDRYFIEGNQELAIKTNRIHHKAVERYARRYNKLKQSQSPLSNNGR